MGDIKHELVTESFYSVVLRTSIRMMPQRINEFFDGFDFESLDEEAWCDCNVDIRDFDGDYAGVKIYYSEDIESLYDYISKKLGIEREVIGNNTIKITYI